MRATYSINPLMLLIMTQAWCHVKRTAPPSSGETGTFGFLPRAPQDPNIPVAARTATSFQPEQKESKQEKSETLHLSVRTAQELPEGEAEGQPLVVGFFEEHFNPQKIISPEAWKYVWSHPFFQDDGGTGPLSIRQLARGWDDPQQDFLVVPSAAALSNISSAPRAVRIPWDPAWEHGLPSWVLDLLEWKAQHNTQVWMEVCGATEPVLNENVCRQAVQMGWSWWLSPPSTVANLPAYFEAHKNLWRFWFTHPHSDQWVWPWSDIILKTLSERLLGRPQERYWLTDQRQKNAWSRLDADAWQHLEKIMGGSGIFRSLVCSALTHLERTDFMDRPFDRP